MKAVGIVLFPFSWAFGVWHKPSKTLYALGPLRFVLYYTNKQWKED